MNEELQKALVEILNGVLTAKDFMLAELPEVIQQLLVWKFWESLSEIMIGILLVIIAFIVRRLFQKLGELNSSDNIFSYLLCGTVSIIIMACTINFVWLQIWLAPKVYLIEYAASLTK